MLLPAVQLGLTLTLALVTAEAAPDTAAELSLTWSAPPACPSEADARAAIERLAAVHVARTSATATAELRAEGSGFALVLAVGNAAGSTRRTLHDESCLALTDAAALVIAVAMDAQAVARTVAPVTRPAQPTVARPRRRAAPTPPPAPARVVEPPADTPSPPAAVPSNGTPTPSTDAAPARPSARGFVVVGAGIAVSAAQVPEVRPAPELWFGVVGGGFSLAAVGRYLPRSVRNVAGQDAGVEIHGGDVDLLGCFAPASRPHSFELCTGVTASTLRGRGVQVPTRSTRHDLAVYVPVSAAWTYTRARWRVALGIQALIGVRRPAFNLDGREVWRQSGGAGLAFARFGRVLR